jgi:predicted DCC family thiol-disulfide oxidoreductase YuxK
VNQTEQHIILFDGLCKLCHFSVRFVIKHDKNEKFHFVSLQSSKGKKLLQQAGLPENYLNGLVYINGSDYFQDSTGVLRILKELDGIWKAFYIFILIPRKIRDSIYHFIARTRYRIFGKYESCPIPTEESKHRFLE